MNKLKELETQFNTITPPPVNVNLGLKLIVNQNGILTIAQARNNRADNQLDLTPDQAQMVFDYLKDTLDYV